MALPAEVSIAADHYYRAAARHSADVAGQAISLWKSIPPDMSLVDGWPTIAGPLMDTIVEGQVASAALSAGHLQAQAWAQGFDLDTLPEPVRFVTPTATSLYWTSYAPGQALHAANVQGMAEVMAREIGAYLLGRTVHGMVTDAGREASQAGITANPTLVGYYRKLQTPSCARCAVLAGAFYRWNEGFRRHPVCDCEHVPAADHDDSLAFDPIKAIEAGEVSGVTKADRKALEDGADVVQLINAKRYGLRTVDIFGERVQITQSGMTRGLASSTMSNDARNRLFVQGKMRLTPREIYKQAGADRDHARRLLTRHGYIL